MPRGIFGFRFWDRSRTTTSKNGVGAPLASSSSLSSDCASSLTSSSSFASVASSSLSSSPKASLRSFSAASSFALSSAMRFWASFSRSLFSFSRAFFWAVLNDLRGASYHPRPPPLETTHGVKAPTWDAEIAPRRLPPHRALFLILLLPERVEHGLFPLLPERFIHLNSRFILIFGSCRRRFYGGRGILPSARRERGE